MHVTEKKNPSNVKTGQYTNLHYAISESELV